MTIDDQPARGSIASRRAPHGRLRGRGHELSRPILIGHVTPPAGVRGSTETVHGREKRRSQRHCGIYSVRRSRSSSSRAFQGRLTFAVFAGFRPGTIMIVARIRHRLTKKAIQKTAAIAAVMMN
jgi:hypothetical protein